MTHAPDQAELPELPELPFPAHSPFVQQLGLRLHRCGQGESELSVTLDNVHMNAWDVAHGGVLMTMMDVAMVMAARGDDLSGPGCVTIELKTTFMRAAEGRLRALGRLMQRTATMAFCEASVLDAQGQLCAHATGTFKYLRAMPTRRTLKPFQRVASDAPATDDHA